MTARYLLREIEHAKRQTEEVSIEGTDRVHVEHIYPQQPLEGQRWPNHAAMLNRLGNLTLLGRRLNASIRNAAFETKKQRAYETSDILITRELLGYRTWDPAAIATRQEELAGWAFRAWQFPGETDPGAVTGAPLEAEPSAAELPDVPDAADIPASPPAETEL